MYVELKNINKTFKTFKASDDISFGIERGKLIGLLGPSGSGKTTILRMLAGLEQPDSGDIYIDGIRVNDLPGSKRGIGFVFQNYALFRYMTVYDNIAFGLEVQKKGKKEIKDRVLELLELVGLSGMEKRYPHQLSGGQKQRVAIARALTLEPKILLCDEATSALDPGTTKSILALIKEINEKLNITVVMVTHQMEVIKEICNRVALIEDGEIKICGLVKDLFLRPEGELKKLLCGDEVLPTQGVNIKIFFPGEVSENSIITSMARELDMDFSIVWGKLENFRQEVLGSLIINVEVGQRDRICNYLDKKSIGWEVI